MTESEKPLVSDEELSKMADAYGEETHAALKNRLGIEIPFAPIAGGYRQGWIDCHGRLESALRDLREKLKLAEEGLEYYGNIDNHRWSQIDDECPESVCSLDGGDKARTILSKIRGGND